MSEHRKDYARPYADVNTPFIVDERGAFAEFIVQDPDLMPELALGTTVIVKDISQGEIYFVSGSVVGLRAISPFSPARENLLYIEPDHEDPTELLESLTGPHTHQPMVIRVKLEQEMKPIEGEERKFALSAVQRPPTARSHMSFPEIVPGDNPAPSLQEILNVKPEGLNLGKIGFGNEPYENSGNYLTYRWDIANLDNKHIFIVGESGSGKTVFLKNLAYQIRKNNSSTRIIMTDVQGDIVQLLLPNVAEKISPRGWQKNLQYESPDDIIDKLSPFQLLVPARKGEASTNVIALKRLAEKNGIEVNEIGLRMQDVNLPSDVEYLFNVSSDQVAMLLDDQAEFIRSKNQPATLDFLKRSLERKLNDQNIRGNQIPNDAGTSFYRTTYFAALRALRSLGNYFDHHQLSLSSSENPLDCLDFPGTTIFYLDELDHDERVMWEMQLVKWLYERKKDNWNAFVFFDEAHQIIPAKPSGLGSDGTFDRLRVNFERLAREGRKFGINLVLSTQNPKDLHPIVDEQCPTKIVMKINPRNARYVNLRDDLATIANRFSHGQFWIVSPFNDTPDWVRVHSEATPLPHESMTRFWTRVIQKAKD